MVDPHDVELSASHGCARSRTVLRRALALLATTVLVLGCTVGCGYPDRSAAADSIGQEIRSLPGVTDAEVFYNTSFDGGAHFRLTATLAAAVTDEQGAAVARTFVNRMTAADFSQFEVTLGLVYRRSGLSPTSDRANSANDSGLTVIYYPTTTTGPSADAVADSVPWWLDIARSSQLTAVDVSLPLDGPYTDVSPPIVVAVPTSADDPVLNALIDRHPQLKSAAWVVSLPSPKSFVHPDVYTSIGRFPDHRSREAWQQLVDLLRPAALPRPVGNVEGRTQIPPRTKDSAPTEVTVNLALDWDTAGEFDHVARRGMTLLHPLPAPVLFKLNARVLDSRVPTPDRRPIDRHLTVTIGGCTPPDPQNPQPLEPLETELRHKYEKC